MVSEEGVKNKPNIHERITRGSIMLDAVAIVLKGFTIERAFKLDATAYSV